MIAEFLLNLLKKSDKGLYNSVEILCNTVFPSIALLLGIILFTIMYKCDFHGKYYRLLKFAIIVIVLNNLLLKYDICHLADSYYNAAITDDMYVFSNIIETYLFDLLICCVVQIIFFLESIFVYKKKNLS